MPKPATHHVAYYEAGRSANEETSAIELRGRLVRGPAPANRLGDTVDEPTSADSIAHVPGSNQTDIR